MVPVASSIVYGARPQSPSACPQVSPLPLLVRRSRHRVAPLGLSLAVTLAKGHPASELLEPERVVTGVVGDLHVTASPHPFERTGAAHESPRTGLRKPLRLA